MGKPLMLQEADAERISELQRRTGAKTKIAVVRRALMLLERRVERADREKRWVRAVRLTGTDARPVDTEIQPVPALRRVP